MPGDWASVRPHPDTRAPMLRTRATVDACAVPRSPAKGWWWQRAAYDRRFAQNRDQNLFRGVFATAEEAARSAPRNRPIGYDTVEAAAMYRIPARPDTHDYPALFWLSRAIADGARTVFDIGGHVGIKFYAFRDALRYPADLRWTVCDVPAVVEAGRRIAIERGVAGQLGFTVDHDAVCGVDVLFASGVLQYLPQTLPDWLARLSVPPRQIVVNTAPLHPEREFFTLNSIGTGFCPYRVMHEAALVAGLARLGYRALDRWTNAGKGLVIPFESGYDVPDYRGLTLIRD